MKSGSASQSFVDIQEIRDDVIILRSGELRGTLSTSSLNLALQSDEEQEATMSQFQGFLNALEFDIQIMVESRRYNLRQYIKTLEERLPLISEDLLQVQTRDYIRFIQFMNDQVNIMRKRFYVVIPYGGEGLTTGTETIKRFFNKQKTQGMQQTFEEKRSQLEQRLSIVEQGLVGLGLEVTRVKTEELIQLFYKIYNPGEEHTISAPPQ